MKRKYSLTATLLAAILLCASLPLYASAATTYSGRALAAVNTDLSTDSRVDGSFSDISEIDADLKNLTEFFGESSGMEGISKIEIDPVTGGRLYVRSNDLPDVPIMTIPDSEQQHSMNAIEPEEPQSYTTSSTKVIYDSKGVSHDMECLYIGKYCTVWGSDNDGTDDSTNAALKISYALAKSIGDQYDEYDPQIREAFGDYYDADGDGKLAILCFDINQDYKKTAGNDFYGTYTAGYFWSVMLADENKWVNGKFWYNTDSKNCAHMDCICLDTFPGMGNHKNTLFDDVEERYSTLVHEAQHLINFSYSISSSISGYYDNMETYLNEAFSMASEHMICGSDSTADRVNYFNNSSDYIKGTPLAYWNGSLSNYANSYLFGQYIRTRYAVLKNDPADKDGYTIYKSVLQQRQKEKGQRGTLEQIADVLGTTPKQLVLDFWAAIYLKNDTGWYGFRGETWADRIRPLVSTSTEKDSIGNGSVRYYNLNGGSMNVSTKNNVTMIQFNSDGSVTMDGVPVLSDLAIQRTAENKAKLSFTASLAGTLKYAPTESIAVDPNELTKSVTFSAGSNTVELDLSGRTSDTPTLSYFVEGSDVMSEITSLTVPAFRCSVTIVPPEHGTISLFSGGQTITSGEILQREQEITVTATPDDGYELDSILVDGKPLDGDTFTVTGAHTVTAVFIQCSVTITQSSYGTITLSVNGSPVESGAILKRGQTVTIAVTAEEGYTLKSILVDGKAISGNTFTVTGVHTVSAQFNINSCGTNARWSLSNGCLKILGNGAMSNYSRNSSHPGWYNQSSSITSVEIASGITSIGQYAFYNCTNLKSVFFRGNAPSFGNNCFYKVVAIAYYDANASGWTSSARQNYGGTITWLDINDHASHQSGELLQTLTLATCTQNGLGKYQCACGEIIEKSIPALGHDVIHHAGQAATCTESGFAAYDTCSRCDYTTYRVIETLGHSYGTPTYMWTPVEGGYTCTAERACTRDNSHTESETVGATYAVTKEATLTEDGTGTYTASFANAAFSQQTRTITLTAAVEDDTTDTVTVELSDEVIDDMVDAATNAPDGTIQLDLSKYSNCDTVALPETLIGKICVNADVEAATIQTADAELTVDRAILKTIEKELDGGTVQFHIRPEAEEYLEDTKKGTWDRLFAAQESANVVHVELSVVNKTTETIHELGGTAQIKVPYTPPKDMTGKKLIAYCIAEDGSLETVSAKYENGYATISTQHFSDFVLLVSDSIFSVSDGVFCRCEATLEKLTVSGSLDGKRLCLVSYAASGKMLAYTEVAEEREIALPEGAHRVKLISLDEQCRPCAEQTVFEKDEQ